MKGEVQGHIYSFVRIVEYFGGTSLNFGRLLGSKHTFLEIRACVVIPKHDVVKQHLNKTHPHIGLQIGKDLHKYPGIGAQFESHIQGGAKQLTSSASYRPGQVLKPLCACYCPYCHPWHPCPRSCHFQRRLA